MPWPRGRDGTLVSYNPLHKLLIKAIKRYSNHYPNAEKSESFSAIGFDNLRYTMARTINDITLNEYIHKLFVNRIAYAFEEIFF